MTWWAMLQEAAWILIIAYLVKGMTEYEEITHTSLVDHPLYALISLTLSTFIVTFPGKGINAT